MHVELIIIIYFKSITGKRVHMGQLTERSGTKAQSSYTNAGTPESFTVYVTCY